MLFFYPYNYWILKHVKAYNKLQLTCRSRSNVTLVLLIDLDLKGKFIERSNLDLTLDFKILYPYIIQFIVINKAKFNSGNSDRRRDHTFRRLNTSP